MSEQERANVQRVAESVRAKGYVDLDRSSDLTDWVEDVVLPVIEVMREQGWVVEPPPNTAGGTT